MSRRAAPKKRTVNGRRSVAGLVVALVFGLATYDLIELDTPSRLRSLASAILAVAPITILPGAGTGCGLLVPGSDGARSTDCLTCHAALSTGGHPYDIDYRAVGGSRRFRTIEEAIRRGVFLPDGQIRCVTCHGRNSPWKYHIRLPAGAQPTHAIDRQRPQTYENPAALPPPRPGDAVGTKPLCLECHALD